MEPANRVTTFYCKQETAELVGGFTVFHIFKLFAPNKWMVFTEKGFFVVVFQSNVRVGNIERSLMCHLRLHLID